MRPPRAFTRETLAGWAGVAGVLALLAGGLIALLAREITYGVFACVLVGAAGIAFWMWAAPDDLRAWLAGRPTRYGTTSVLVSAVFIGAIAYAYILVDRANITADLTAVQRYPLNAPSLEVIDQLAERGVGAPVLGGGAHPRFQPELAVVARLDPVEPVAPALGRQPHADPHALGRRRPEARRLAHQNTLG